MVQAEIRRLRDELKAHSGGLGRVKSGGLRMALKVRNPKLQPLALAPYYLDPTEPNYLF